MTMPASATRMPGHLASPEQLIEIIDAVLNEDSGFGHYLGSKLQPVRAGLRLSGITRRASPLPA